MDKMKQTHYKIRITDPANRPSEPFSIVVLADLHNAEFDGHNERLLQTIREISPKAVLSAGDLIVAKSGRREYNSAIALLGELTRWYPVYCVNGNHETRMSSQKDKYELAYEQYESEIRSLGVRLLRNQRETIRINRMKMTIYGFETDLSWYRRGRSQVMQAEELTEKLGDADPETYSILLAHNPDFFAAYAAWGADLTLAGHVHGGIVRLPWLGGVISPNLTLFPKYDRGLYRIGKRKMIVSAGLSSHTIKLRINNPPELVVLDII